VVKLEQNYRSTQTILDAANAVIANNAMRKPKALWTEQVGGELISRYHAEDEHDEATWVVHELSRLHRQEHMHWGEAAVFYRANAQSRVLEEELARLHRAVVVHVDLGDVARDLGADDDDAAFHVGIVGGDALEALPPGIAAPAEGGEGHQHGQADQTPVSHPGVCYHPDVRLGNS